MAFSGNRLSIPPKRFRIWLSDDGGCNASQEYKEPSSYYSEICLTIIMLLYFELIDMETMNVPSVLSHLFISRNCHRFFEFTAENVANHWDFKAFEVYCASKDHDV